MSIDAGEPDELSLVAEFHVFLAGVAIHTTSAALTHLIFDLCEYHQGGYTTGAKA